MKSNKNKSSNDTQRKKRKHNPNTLENNKKIKSHKPDSSNNISEAQRLLYYEEKCSRIAQLSEEILENPQEGVKQPHKTNIQGCKNESKLKELLNYANTFHDNNNDSNNTHNVVIIDYNVGRLAIISLLAIFQDTLPSYRIRQHTQVEMKGQRLKKETKELWDYEHDLVSYYQQYLKILEKTWASYCCSSNNSKGKCGQGAEEDPEKYQLGITCLLTLCELLKKAYYFNFVSNILTLVVRQMSSKISIVSATCCKTIHILFKVDKQGDITREAVKLISQMIHQRKFNIQPQVLQSFLFLPLQVKYEDVVAVRLLQKEKQKKRKKHAEQCAIEDEMKEADGNIDKMQLVQMQSDTLHSVTITYFRIVKAIQQTTTTQSQYYKNAMTLLPYALEGLAKFAHLIHIDTVLDLMELIKTLLLQQMEDFDYNDKYNHDPKKQEYLQLHLSMQTICHCVLTAFKALSGPGRDLEIDMKEFIVPLYNQITRFSTECNSIQTPLLIQCLTQTFLKRREYSIPRLIAFLKMLLTLSLSAPTYTSIPVLTLIQQIIHKYPNASSQLEQLLFENENDKVMSASGSGAYYNPTVQDPELCNPLSTSAWEISLLKYHFNNDIQQKVTSMTKDQKIGDNFLIVQKNPSQMFHDIKVISDNGLMPMVDGSSLQKKHNLKNLIKKDKRKKGTPQHRFVRPKPLDLTRY